jgi:hypothetical protein
MEYPNPLMVRCSGASPSLEPRITAAPALRCLGPTFARASRLALTREHLSMRELGDLQDWKPENA